MSARILRASSLALAALLLAPPAAAWHDDETPLLHSGTTDEPLWVSYRFATDGAKAVLDMEAYQVGLTQLGGYLYAANDELIFGFSFTSVPTWTGVYLDANVAGRNVHADVIQPTPDAPFIKIGLTINGEGAEEPLTGELKVLLWASGRAKRVVYGLRGDEGVTYEGHKTGSDAFLRTSKDFGGTATVYAGTGTLASARANAMTSLARAVDDTLIGVYFPVFSSVDQMSADTPSGTRTCSCFFSSFVPDWAGVPATSGPYTFRVTGAGAGGGLGDILLGGADAQLPEDADLELAGLSVDGAPAQIEVGETAELTVRGTVVSHGPWRAMDAQLVTQAEASGGATVAPEAAGEPARLAVGQPTELTQTFTVGCAEPGPRTVTFDASAAPLQAADRDPAPGNDARTVSVAMDCVTG